MLAMSKARFEMEMYEQQVKMQRMRMEAERAIQVCADFPTFQILGLSKFSDFSQIFPCTLLTLPFQTSSIEHLFY